MIKAIAIDDEPLALTIIEHYCRQMDTVALEKTFTKTDEALRYLKKYPVDLIFLDIQMPGKNGIDFYKSVDSNIMVIFTTAYSEYAVEGFNISAIDYLLKPFSKERFTEAIAKAQKEMDYRRHIPGTGNILFIRADYKLHKIDADEILLIEGLDDYVRIHIQDKPAVTARLSMKGILEKLPEQAFIRVHRSYIVPVKRISTIHNKSIKIDDFVIPIGDTYKDVIAKFL